MEHWKNSTLHLKIYGIEILEHTRKALDFRRFMPYGKRFMNAMRHVQIIWMEENLLNWKKS